MKIVEADGFRFEFSDAVEAFVFDEKDSRKATFHGVPMKGVDIVAEFEEAYVFIEIKDYADSSRQDQYDTSYSSDDEKQKKKEAFKWLKSYLKYKYRDTYLYRHAEEKVDKPIHYVCLLTFDNAINTRIKRALVHELPVGKKSPRWGRALATSLQVVNLAKWNSEFPRWAASRI